MTDRLHSPERNECRLIVIDAHSMRILTTASAAGPLLPHEPIPAFSRVAEALNEAIEQRYGLCTVQFRHPPWSRGAKLLRRSRDHGFARSGTQIAFLRSAGRDCPSELTEAERSLVLKIMKGEAKELGRFARLGWIDELLAKTGSRRDRNSMPIIRQLNQGIDFCLLHLQDANGRNLWFKAVGEPNTREYPLTQELTRQFPEYLPKLVAWIPEWNGWITEGVAGAPLNHSGDKAVWEQVLTALAFMQRNSIENKACLCRAGAKEWSSAAFFPFRRHSLKRQNAPCERKPPQKPIRSAERASNDCKRVSTRRSSSSLTLEYRKPSSMVTSATET